MSQPTVTGVLPPRATQGGRITLIGSGLFADQAPPTHLKVGDRRARVVFAAPDRVSIILPGGLTEAGATPIQFGASADQTVFFDHASPIATGLHQVDNPVIDRSGNVYVTYSGTRGQQVPVSIFRVAPNGARETFSSAIVNPTSMALDRHGRLYVSSRFEGTVYRVAEDGSAEPFATDLGVACGLAFAPDGTLFVGDRTGTIFRVDPEGKASAFASLPSSVAAFHLAVGGDGLYVTAPTLSAYDVVYRLGFDGSVAVHNKWFGRPQGIAFGPDGALFVIEALAGASGLYRLNGDARPELVLAGPNLVGVAFDPLGALVVCSNATAFRLPHYA